MTKIFLINSMSLTIPCTLYLAKNTELQTICPLLLYLTQGYLRGMI